ncbi:redox-regulated ATPase YchF [Patescibacteria group bacterium]|nr:redox-regulated ATPase YchF [Patescibacteria group bacterium]MBU4512196.1 redox-regulated ATPase YchF [Patescibacteria group bacterium]MCG2693455.1 redox-regulated ATPase YchF [Candidatus Parcubacteria bacterium]
MSFSIGIVGLPNVGKSTLFKALTKKQVDASNYPFCTIDPNVGVVKVPDERLEQLAKISQSEKIVPTTIEFVDIAGLVKGAHKGEGLGNQFLSNIREVDAICQVVRNFHNLDVTHIEGEVNPKNDIEIINLELIMADLSTITKRAADTEGKARSGDKELQQLLEIYKKIKTALDDGKLASTVELSNEQQKLIKDLGLLTLKPMLYVINIDEEDIKQKPDSQFNGQQLAISLSAKIESEIAELEESEAKEYMQEAGIQESGLDRLIIASYKLLNLITFFASGPKETHAWTISQGAKAPEAAGKIHTDFEEGFIKAEIINWQDFVRAGGEHLAKEKGLMHLEGKNYEMQDGDVCLFHFK